MVCVTQIWLIHLHYFIIGVISTRMINKIYALEFIITSDWTTDRPAGRVGSYKS